ncbi:MAG: iron-containing alcohol dehydrogenase, partial [Tissierellaceae bacterium]
KVIDELEGNQIPYFELSGIEPNPKLGSVLEGVRIARENKVDFVLSVGGGSSIDTGKVIAAAYYYQGDPWDLIIRKAKIEKLLPIGTVLTLAATGSEMDAGAVITNEETKQKYGLGHREMYPKFSILDPSFTYSVSTYQTASGVADIMSHTFEEYFSNVRGAYLQDRLAEAILKTCIRYGRQAIDEPDNYEARSNLMWAAPLAINNLLAYGKDSEWSVHPLQHELSAHYDVTHGISLAILTPHWMEHVLDENTLFKFREYGINVWDIDPNIGDMEIAKEAIERTREFFKSLDIPMTLREIGIEEEKLETMARAVIDHNGGRVGNFKALDYDDVLTIYKKAL